MKALLLLTTLISFSTHAEVVARVMSVAGEAFAVKSGKGLTQLKRGDRITALSDVMVEDSGKLILASENFEQSFELAGGSMVKLHPGRLEIKNGEVWTRSKNTTQMGQVSTANALVKHQEGNFVVAFDNQSRKTQLLVITGDVTFSNAQEPELNTSVVAGMFSFIDPEYENSLPRTPTKIGRLSLAKMHQKFPQLADIMRPKPATSSKNPSRSIASVANHSEIGSSPKGRVIKLYGSSQAERSPASAFKYYKKLKKTAAKSAPKAKASVRYFGAKWQPPQEIKTELVQQKIEQAPQPQEAKRVPASIPSIKIANPMVRDLQKSQFESSLEQKEQGIKRHSDEVNFLIDNLKSYKKDFQKDY